MKTRILIIGGYGNFGSFIARVLGREENIQLILGGRNIHKARVLSHELAAKNTPESTYIDIDKNLSTALAETKPDIVIHTSGPFQGQGYDVAKTCIAHQCHYIDLADSREFVANITQLNEDAKDNDVLICTGASSVPCLTAAIIDEYIGGFKTLEKVDYGIATAQLTNRGVATTSAVLSYAGKSFTTLIDGKMQNVYGWLGLRWRRFWKLNLRPMGYCDIPDLDLFPQRYPSLKTLRFQAGLELKILHIILVMLSSLVKIRVLNSLQPLAPFLLKASYFFDFFGKDDSGFYMTLSGKDQNDRTKEVTFNLVARHGDGLYIPSMPAILLAKKLANSEVDVTGATACVDLISLTEFLDGLSEFDMAWQVQ